MAKRKDIKLGEFTLPISISFGHCDPAAIVFYPNYFRWFDRCFHTFLAERAGGHNAICAQLGAKGIGLIDVKANFPSPAVEGDEMSLVLSIEKWSDKTLTLGYEGKVGDRVVVSGSEIRGLFIQKDGRMRAGEMAPLRALLDPAP
ncbi:acyl-CoA thioesterase [Sulfitobacter sp. BDSS02]|nr:acyl-CoA thioesterase [Sulfitobacter sp. BDSS02]